MNEKMLSVIIPVYNAEKTVGRCLKSVLNQRYEYFEVIVVNDGSKDSSLELCKKEAEKDNRIIIVDQKNTGVSAARLKGIMQARGKYVTFVDADDYLNPGMYEKMMREIQREEADIIECGYIVFDGMNENLSHSNYSNCKLTGTINCLENYLLENNSSVFLWNKIYKKSLFERLELPSYAFSEDYLWNVLIVGRCNKKITIPDKFYHYYKNPAGACNGIKYGNVKKMDGIKAGISSRKYLHRNFPELEKYAVKYIIDYSRFIYGELYLDERSRRKECREIKQYYRQHFNCKTISIMAGYKKMPGYILFWTSPTIYYHLNKIYHKIFG